MSSDQPPPHPHPFPSPSSFSRFHPGQLSAVRFSWGAVRRCHQHRFPCLLDLLILLHLNFINCSTGPEAEKNENSLCGNSFFSYSLLSFFVVRSDMIPPKLLLQPPHLLAHLIMTNTYFTSVAAKKKEKKLFTNTWNTMFIWPIILDNYPTERLIVDPIFSQVFVQNVPLFQ